MEILKLNNDEIILDLEAIKNKYMEFSLYSVEILKLQCEINNIVVNYGDMITKVSYSSIDNQYKFKVSNLLNAYRRLHNIVVSLERNMKNAN